MKKRIISVLLSLVMALTVVSVWDTETVQATEEKNIGEELVGYRRVTLNEFTWGNGGAVTQITTADAGFGGYRISDAFYGSVTTVEGASSRSLDKTYLDFDLKTDISSTMQLHLFSQQKWHHYIRVKFYDSNRIDFTYFNDGTGDSSTQSPQYQLSNFGRESASDYFNLKVRADFTENASDSTKRDAVLQFWINNQFAYEMSLTATDLRNGFVTGSGGNSSDTFYVKLPTVTLDDAVEGSFDSWTFRDVNLGDVTVTGNNDFNYVKPTAGTASLNGSLFQGRINFGSSTWNDIPVLMIGGSPLAAANVNCGFRFRGSTNALAFDFFDTSGNQLTGSTTTLYSSTAGTALTNNDDLIVSISVNFLDVSDGLVKAAVGLFFDGMLYNNEYFIISNIPEEALTRHVKVHGFTTSVNSLSIASYPDVELTKWTFSDMSVADQTLTTNVSLNNRPAPADASSSDKTLFQGLVNFPNASYAVGEFFVSGSKTYTYAGLFFRDDWTTNNLILRYRKETGVDPVTIGTFTPGVAGTALRGNGDLLLGLSVEITSEPDAEGNVDTRLGVYFDGKLYNNKYIAVSLPQDILFRDIKWSSPQQSGTHIASYPQPETPEGGEVSTETAKLYMNAEITDIITIKFRAELTEEEAALYDDVKLRVSLGGTRTLDIEPITESDGSLSFYFTDIYSQYMTDKITASLFAVEDEEEIVLVSNNTGISFEEYCDLLNTSFSYDSKLVRFMAEMLNFGAECQKIKGYKTDSLAGEDLAWVTGTALSAPVSPVSDGEISVLSDTSDSARIKSASLNIANTIQIVFNVMAEDTEDLTISVSGDGINTVTNLAVSELSYAKGVYTLKLNRITPSYYNSVVTAQLRRGGNLIHTINYSVNTYCVRKVSTPSMTDIVSAIYNYGVAASAYANR
ncbi:MAG: hypothetical protein IJU01_05490 [Lachnospiraceae bacterium]|nr:hypothetical protein [Lachnospiraceae bacterium]